MLEQGHRARLCLGTGTGPGPPADGHGNDDRLPARVQHLPRGRVPLGNDDPDGQQGDEEGAHQGVHVGFALWAGGEKKQRNQGEEEAEKSGPQELQEGQGNLGQASLNSAGRGVYSHRG